MSILIISYFLSKRLCIGMDFLVRKDYQRVLLYIFSVFFILFVLKYLLPYFLPLGIALLIVVPLQRFCAKKSKDGKIHNGGKSIMAGGVLFGIILIAALILVGLGTFLISKTRGLVKDFGFITENITDIMNNFCTGIEDFFGLKKGVALLWVEQSINSIGGSIAGSGNGLIKGGVKYVTIMGHIVTFILVSFICVVLFAREIEIWQQGLLNLAALEPAIDRLLSIVLRIGKKLGNMIKAYVKTQSIIFICISITSTIGLYLGGVKDAFFYGILAGFMDFLPFIGTGIVLIPIGVIRIISGNFFSGMIILISYFLCVVTREFLEPRLLGNGLKFSPVAILISVYAGLMFYGIGGVILGPVTLLILVELGREIFRTVD